MSGEKNELFLGRVCCIDRSVLNHCYELQKEHKQKSNEDKLSLFLQKDKRHHVISDKFVTK